MSEHFALDDIHEMIDQLDVALSKIHARPTDEVDPWDIDELIQVVEDLLEYDSAYNSLLPSQLGIPASTFRKLTVRGNRGPLRKQVMVQVTERLRTYLRTLESEVQPSADVQDEPATPPAVDDQSSVQGTKELVEVPAHRWVIVPKDDQLQEKIDAVSLLLEDVIFQLSGSNLPEEQQILKKLQRAQLIAILETALNVLQSPAVESGLLTDAKDRLRDAANKSADKQLQQGLEVLMRQIVDQLTDLIMRIFT